MHQKPLLDSTRDFFLPTEEKQKGIRKHERYESALKYFGVATIAAMVILYTLGDYSHLLIFGVVLGVVAFSSEYLLRRMYGFTAKDAVFYYAIRFYDEPTEENLAQLQSWNRNPFDLTTEYQYQNLGELVEKAKQEENTVEFAHENIPDILRFIERQENDDFRSLVSIDTEIPDYYEQLIQEANYCYKFGAYTSASILIRKIAESLVTDILTAKGVYAQLEDETFGDEINLLTEEIIKPRLQDRKESRRIQESLHQIRKSGNKAAHMTEEITQDDIRQLVGHANTTLSVLFEIRAEEFN